MFFIEITFKGNKNSVEDSKSERKTAKMIIPKNKRLKTNY